MFIRSLNVPKPLVVTPISSKVMLLVSGSSSDEFGVCCTSKFEAFDIAGSLKDFHSSDFSIKALSSVGALGKLKTTYMSNMSDLNVADTFETLNFENLEK